MKIFGLSEIPKSLLAEVGGKAKGLHELISFSFPVPEGFVLIDAKHEDEAAALARYKESGLGKVAVRSSATAEDGVNFSGAGQYETVLGVDGEEAFVSAFHQCVSSLGNERSKKYSETFLADGENKMNVVVQQMVDAKFAGVLFTKDPLEKKGVLIECVQGLGESLVSGTQSSQQYRVAETISMPENAWLDEETVALLADYAKKAAKLFGMEMDMEWAIDESGKILFLQARPITVTDDGVTVSEFDYPHDVTDYTITTCNVREMMPTAVTPLTLSTSMYCLDYGMRKMMAKNHAVKRVEDLPPYACITPFYNNMFFNMTTNYINAYRVAGTCKETSDIVICGRVLDEFPDKFADYSSNFVRVKNLFHFLPFVLSDKIAKNGMDETIVKINFNYDDTAEGLYKQTNDLFPFLQDVFFYHYCSSYYSGAASMSAIKGLGKYYPDANELNALLSGALTNIDGVESAQIINMMKALVGAILEEYPNAKSYSKEELASVISSSTGKIKAAYDEFMEKNGHRGVRECELRINCWSDDLIGFCDSLKGVVATYGQDEGKKTKDWTEYLEQLLSPVKKSKRKSLRNLVMRARNGARCREYTKSRCMLAVSRYRKAYRLIAEKLVERSLLPEADLLFFLTKEEVGKLIAGDKTLVKKAMKRRRLYPVQCAMRFEEVSCGKPIPIQETPKEGESSFRGIPASPGIVSGKVRIVNTLEDANSLQEGEIMVAACTDVGWTPYYCLAAGLITEIGSCLSHGVVVAREYGLPTVVNARNILHSVKNGDVIRMDGSTGNVTVIG